MKKESKTSLVFWSMVIILLAFSSYYGFGYLKRSTNKQAGHREIVVEAHPLEISTNKIKHRYIGYVTPIHEASVTPYINGYLDQILVKGGDEVGTDDILVIIRQGEYKAALDAAKATLLQTKAGLDNAAVYYKRVKAAGLQAMSKTDIDNAKAQFLSAQAAVAKAEADVEQAKIDYDYTLIKAPIPGIVGNVELTPGNYVSPGGGALFTIVQYNPIRVVFSIADKEYLEILRKSPDRLFKNEQIKLILADGSTYDKFGEFKYIDNSLNRNTNSVAVYVDFENAKRRLLPNAYVTVEIEKKVLNSIFIRQNLVTMKQNGNFATIVRNGKLIEQKVEIIDVSDNNYLLADNFQKGDLLVTKKSGPLRPGNSVRINIIKEENK